MVHDLWFVNRQEINRLELFWLELLELLETSFKRSSNLNFFSFSVHQTTDSLRGCQHWPVGLLHARTQAQNRQKEIHFQEKSANIQSC